MPFPGTARQNAPRKRSRNCAVSAISGNEDQALASGFESLRRRLEIDFRLAGAVTPSSKVTENAWALTCRSEWKRPLAARLQGRVARKKDRSGAPQDPAAARLSQARPRRSACRWTPLEQAAVSASAALEKARPPSAAARTRARALVMRCGGGPARRTPTRARFRSGVQWRANRHPQHHAAAGSRSQRATQSMNFRHCRRSGGLARRERWISDCASVAPDRTSQTTPCVIFVPSGTSTKSPGATDMPLGTA